jgi:hypothetical protein
MLISCSPSFIDKRYVFVEPYKGWEIELKFYADSTFTLKDIYGNCHKMTQKGKWKVIYEGKKDSNLMVLVLSDTTKIFHSNDWHNKKWVSYKNNLDNGTHTIPEYDYFPLVSEDTARILHNHNKLKFRTYKFSKFNGNIQNKGIKIRLKELKDVYGRKNLVKYVGEGKSMKKVRSNLKICNYDGILP